MTTSPCTPELQPDADLHRLAHVRDLDTDLNSGDRKQLENAWRQIRHNAHLLAENPDRAGVARSQAALLLLRASGYPGPPEIVVAQPETRVRHSIRAKSGTKLRRFTVTLPEEVTIQQLPHLRTLSIQITPGHS